MSLFFSNARRTASPSVSVTVRSSAMPSRARLGSGGREREWISEVKGKDSSPAGVDVPCGATSGGAGVTCEGATPGGVCGAGRCVPGGVVGGSCCAGVPGRAVAGAGTDVPLEGGRVASCRCSAPGGVCAPTGRATPKVASVSATIANKFFLPVFIVRSFPAALCSFHPHHDERQIVVLRRARRPLAHQTYDLVTHLICGHMRA